MVRTCAVVVLLLSLVPYARAQMSGVYVSEGDTVRYTYTPHEAQASVAVEPQAPHPEKSSFLRRVVKYFEGSTVDRTFEKKIDFTFAGGPSYSKNTSFGIGGLAAGLYRLDRTDSVTPPSDVSIFASVSVSGFYSLGVEGNNLFSHNRQRINYTVMFSSAPRDLWGIGYLAGRFNEEGSYVEKRYLVQARYLHEVLPKTFVGANFNFNHTQGKRFDARSESYLYGQKHQYTATGIGIILEYDSRDFIPNPYEGVYVSFQETFFPRGLGNCDKSLWRTNFTANYYKRLWKGGILATDLYAEFNSEGTPWPLLARLGGSQRMRGYYQGRYTDNDMIVLQVELRQHIWRRIGCAVWGGAGNVFPELKRFEWNHTLPNYGIGLRWELKKRVNVRVDYGFGRKTSGFLLSINEAF